MMDTGMHVIVEGNPTDGFRLIGPFNNGPEALEWADSYLDSHEWRATALSEPGAITADSRCRDERGGAV